MKTRKRVYEIVEISGPGDRASGVFDVFIFSLIVLNVVAMIIGTTELGRGPLNNLLYRFEVFSIVIFSVEYVLRIWTCVEKPGFSSPIKGRLKFSITPLIIIDLLAVLPFYLPFLITLDLRVLRILRLTRIFRLFKMTRYVEGLRLMAKVIKNTKEEILITLSVGFMLLLISSSIMYYMEHDAQPEVFSSIPAAMWWGVATLTTVGYGDVVPATVAGRVLGAIISILGIGMFALPAGIFGSGFMEEIKRKKAPSLKCPHCGQEIKETNEVI